MSCFDSTLHLVAQHLLKPRMVYWINPHWDPESGYNGGGLDVFLTDPKRPPVSASVART